MEAIQDGWDLLYCKRLNASNEISIKTLHNVEIIYECKN